jgi:hypothetical protein
MSLTSCDLQKKNSSQELASRLQTANIKVEKGYRNSAVKPTIQKQENQTELIQESQEIGGLNTLKTSDLTLLDQINSLVSNGKAKRLMAENFESQSLEKIANCSGNCPSIVIDNDAKSYVLRCSLSGNMENEYRTEVSFGNRAKLWSDTVTYLLYFKVKFHSDLGEGFPPSMFVQLHARTNGEENINKSLWQSFVGRVEAGGKGGMWQGERVNGKNTKAKFQVINQEWQQCVAVFRLSNKSDGQIIVYRNGVKEFEANGSNSGNWKDAQYLKMGIYAASNKKEKGKTSMATRTIDYDDIQLLDISSICGEFSKPCNIEDYLFLE